MRMQDTGGLNTEILTGTGEDGRRTNTGKETNAGERADATTGMKAMKGVEKEGKIGAMSIGIETEEEGIKEVDLLGTFPVVGTKRG